MSIQKDYNGTLSSYVFAHMSLLILCMTTAPTHPLLLIGLGFTPLTHGPAPTVVL